MNIPHKFTLIGLLATGIFFGYCYYFDYKRRTSPNYRKKLYEQRKLKHTVVPKFTEKIDYSDFSDHPEIFLKKSDLTISKSKPNLETEDDELKNTIGIIEDIDHGVDNMSNAVLASKNPEELLQDLQAKLKPSVFILILQRLRIRRTEAFPVQENWVETVNY